MGSAPTDWGAWRKCEVCGAGIGEPCLARSGGGPQALPPVEADVPHSSRKQRTGEVSAMREGVWS